MLVDALIWIAQYETEVLRHTLHILLFDCSQITITN